MTYSIAAPMLYKEVVVNNLSSFFFGADDPIQPHHEDCVVKPTTQSTLCHLTKKNDGTAYKCPRHLHPTNHTDNPTPHSTPTPTAFALYHKQELLAKVEALHFLYASADKYIYAGLDIYGAEPESVLFDQCDTRRYKDVPKCVADLQFAHNPLVNLRRATVGRWLDKAWGENISPSDVLWGIEDGSDLAMAMGKFQHYLAHDIPQIAPRFVCRSATTGPLLSYPHMPDYININVLHNPDLHEYGRNIVVGALNIVHITSTIELPAEQIFDDNLVEIVDSFIEYFEGWKDVFDTDELEATTVKYVIHRDTKYSDDEGSTNSYGDEPDSVLFDCWVSFRQQLDSQAFGLDLEVDLKECFEICWDEEEGDCPACQPDTCHAVYRTPCHDVLGVQEGIAQGGHADAGLS